MAELSKYDIDQDYARKCLEANRHNDITTIYYLLIKKWKKQGKVDLVDPNSSLKLDKPLNSSFIAFTNFGENNQQNETSTIVHVEKAELTFSKDNPKKSSAINIYSRRKGSAAACPQVDKSIGFGIIKTSEKARPNHKLSIVSRYPNDVHKLIPKCDNFTSSTGNTPKENFSFKKPQESYVEQSTV